MEVQNSPSSFYQTRETWSRFNKYNNPGLATEASSEKISFGVGET